jgi:hypothetical protein
MKAPYILLKAVPVAVVAGVWLACLHRSARRIYPEDRRLKPWTLWKIRPAGRPGGTRRGCYLGLRLRQGPCQVAPPSGEIGRP